MKKFFVFHVFKFHDFIKPKVKLWERGEIKVDKPQHKSPQQRHIEKYIK